LLRREYRTAANSPEGDVADRDVFEYDTRHNAYLLGATVTTTAARWSTMMPAK